VWNHVQFQFKFKEPGNEGGLDSVLCLVKKGGMPWWEGVSGGTSTVYSSVG
jgi:hypothetical protein